MQAIVDERVPPVLPAAEYRRMVVQAHRDWFDRTQANPYRHMPSHQLADEQEHYGWQMIEMQLRERTDDGVDWSFWVYTATVCLTLIEREQTRRRNLASDAGLPPERLPNRDHLRANIDWSRVKELVTVEDFIERHTVGRRHRSGKSRLVTQCFLPGHADDKSPSFTAYLDQQSWYCFGCGRGGDVIDLGAHYWNNQSPVEVVKLLCALTGVEVPRVKGASLPEPALPSTGLTVIGPDGVARPVRRSVQKDSKRQWR